MKQVVFFTLIILMVFGCKNQQENAEIATKVVNKKLIIPEQVWMVPDSNDYEDPESIYSFSRFRESENIAIFWDKEYGNDPAQNDERSKTFNVDSLVMEGERFFKYYVEELQFLEKGKSTTDTTKILMYVFGGENGTAYGSGKDSIGMIWSPAVRIHQPPYGALAHELGHSFQYLTGADGHFGFKNGGSIWEMTSQWILWQVYPNWIEFENYHLQAFLDNTYRAFLHEENMYHSPFVLEYWSTLHGKTFIGELWRSSKKGEDPVLTYQRLTNINQETFNDEIFDAARRFVTWDLPRIDKVSRKYANIHHSALSALENGWYEIAEKEAPQNYGYNAIALDVPEDGDAVVYFEAITESEKFHIVKPEIAGWRYGFLAVTEDGERHYSEVYSAPENKVSFKIPENTRHLWLVVSGAPKEHSIHKIDGNPGNDEQWPYRLKFENTDLKHEN
ncbi:MAG: DUF6055 domain-containing protein [Bacteroidota bacterium]|nr:DUF6055 domain-containing protein [Bacteroidota bacterium]